LPVIRRLAESSDRTRAEVKAAAAELGYGPTHVYSLIRSYTADPRLTSLLPSKRGRAFGYSKLDSEVEAIINDVIDSLYLTRQKPKIVDLVAEVQRRCIARGLKHLAARVLLPGCGRGRRKRWSPSVRAARRPATVTRRR
jgi:putative transposase